MRRASVAVLLALALLWLTSPATPEAATTATCTTDTDCGCTTDCLD